MILVFFTKTPVVNLLHLTNTRLAERATTAGSYFILGGVK